MEAEGLTDEYDAMNRRTPTRGLAAAWRAVERALPGDWWLHTVAAYSFGDKAWIAEAASPGRSLYGYGRTPAEALAALLVEARTLPRGRRA